MQIQRPCNKMSHFKMSSMLYAIRKSHRPSVKHMCKPMFKDEGRRSNRRFSETGGVAWRLTSARHMKLMKDLRGALYCTVYQNIF